MEAYEIISLIFSALMIVGTLIGSTYWVVSAFTTVQNTIENHSETIQQNTRSIDRLDDRVSDLGGDVQRIKGDLSDLEETTNKNSEAIHTHLMQLDGTENPIRLTQYNDKCPFCVEDEDKDDDDRAV